MRSKNIILGIGIALVIIPLLGFPSAWRNFTVIVLGLWVCAIIIIEKRGGHLFGSIGTGLSSSQKNSTSVLRSNQSESLIESGKSQTLNDQIPQA